MSLAGTLEKVIWMSHYVESFRIIVAASKDVQCSERYTFSLELNPIQ